MECRLVLICLVTLAVPTSMALTMNRRVVNGKAMRRGEWPFLVSLHYLKPYPFTKHSKMEHVCGGALIRKRWVLTAAHCVELDEKMREPEDWDVVLGEHNQYRKESGEQVIKPEAFFPHPGFKPHDTHDVLHDIALIKLSKAAVVSSYVKLMNISTEPVEKDEKCQVGGWGQVSSEPYGWGMYIPLKTTVYAINSAICAKEYADLPSEEDGLRLVVDDTVLCAGIPRDMVSSINDKEGSVNDACNGDSGSPLICQTGSKGKYQIAGVVSAGHGCGKARYPGIYTRVSKYTTWLLDTIAEN